MKFNIGTKITGWLKQRLYDVPQPGQVAAVTGQRIGEWTRQGLAVVLSALMIMIPMGQGGAFAQSVPSPSSEEYYPPVADNGEQVPQGQPLSAGQLDQLVAPIALYPDALLAQVLAASTYPAQVVEADRWLQAQGNAPADQIAAGAENQNWDPSVKALTAFPTVLAQMDRNLQWTTDLGNAYYNQPQDVMDAVQAMRQNAQVAGQLRSTPQQVVTNDAGAITIAPANPIVVYVPVYNPWTVYGTPLPIYPGYYYAPPADVFWGGLAIGFGVGIGVGLLTHWGWGWGHWGMGWGSHAIFFNHNTFITRSATVINRGLNRPGGPPRNFAGRGSYARNAGNFNRPAGGFNRPGYSYRGGANRPGSYNYGRSSGAINRPSASASRPAGGFNRPGYSYRGGANRPGSFNHGRPSGAINRPSASASRPGGNYGRSGSGPRASFPRASMGRGSGTNFGGHLSGGGRSAHFGGGGGHPGGGSAHSGGHSGHGGGGRRG
jgi:hypothetical protein